MSETTRDPPGAFGVEAATRKILDAQDRSFKKLHDDMTAGFRVLHEQIDRIERKVEQMAKNVQDLDTALDAVAANETKLGQDIKTVIDALKNANLPPDLTAQVDRLNQISQDLINSDADTLSNLPQS